MGDFEKLINASDLIEWIMEAYPDWCVGDVRGIVDHIDNMSSVQPKTKCIAEIKTSKEDMEELISEKIEEIKAAQAKIIYCKDCKWKQGSECVMFSDVRPFPDDFCSRAERRTDERT